MTRNCSCKENDSKKCGCCKYVILSGPTGPAGPPGPIDALRSSVIDIDEISVHPQILSDVLGSLTYQSGNLILDQPITSGFLGNFNISTSGPSEIEFTINSPIGTTIKSLNLSGPNQLPLIFSGRYLFSPDATSFANISGANLTVNPGSYNATFAPTYKNWIDNVQDSGHRLFTTFSLLQTDLGTQGLIETSPPYSQSSLFYLVHDPMLSNGINATTIYSQNFYYKLDSLFGLGSHTTHLRYSAMFTLQADDLNVASNVVRIRFKFDGQFRLEQL